MVATAEKDGKVARIGGWGNVWVIWAMPEFKRFFNRSHPLGNLQHF